jgi:iron complex transport system substrate-binding protein
MKKLKILLLLTLASFSAGADDTRIVSLGPYITENLCLLGLEENIVGLTVHDSAEIKKGKEIVGTLLEPNIEKILALKPDIVIGSKEGNREGDLQKMHQLGIKTVILNQLYTFEDICRNLLILGKELNVREKAEHTVEYQKLRLKKIRKNVSRSARTGRKRVFFILGFKPLFTTGSATYINEMIEYAGGTNIFSGVNKKWFSCSIEEVIRRNPENIVFLRMDEEHTVLWDRLRDVDAVNKNRTVGIEPTVIGSPTPESFVDSVELLRGQLLTLDKKGDNP